MQSKLIQKSPIIVGLILISSVISGCGALSLAGSVAGAAVSVTGAAVSTGIKVTGAVVEAAIPDGESK